MSIPCIRALADEHGPIELYLGVSEKDHPFGGKHFSRDRVEWLMPLLKNQDCISAVHVWDGQDIDLDLNLFRRLNVNFASGDIAGWYRWAFPVAYDLSKQWLLVGGVKSDRIVVNRTERYRGSGVHYRFMTGHCVQFVGLLHEYEEFVRQVPDAEYIECKTALDMARLIRGCKFFVGNQSCPFAMAEGLKVPRLLEVCTACPNVIIHGEGGHEAVNQLGFEWCFSRLVKDTSPQPPVPPAR